MYHSVIVSVYGVNVKDTIEDLAMMHFSAEEKNLHEEMLLVLRITAKF